MPLQYGTGPNGGTAVPFMRVSDPMKLSGFASLSPIEQNRLRRIDESQRFYLGQQWSVQREGGEPLVTMNYIRKLVDKSVEFLVAKGFTVNVPSPLAQVSLPFLTEVWKKNRQQEFGWKAAQTGAISGDVFVLVTYLEPDAMEKRLYPYAKGRIKVQLLASEQVFPTWDPLDHDRLLSVRIDTLYQSDPRAASLPGQDISNNNGLLTKRFTQIITPTYIIEQIHGQAPVTRNNILGEIPLVHWQNLPMAGEYYGIADTFDLIDLQREFNEKSTDISDTINYHGNPVTVITGGKAKQLERSSRQLWSGLPSDAKVFNLALGGELQESNNYRESVKDTMFQLSDVPEGSLGTMQPISNTSAAALNTQFEPIIKKTLKKRACAEPGIERINYFILRIGQVMGMIELPFDVCSSCGGRILEVPVPGQLRQQWVPDAMNEQGGSYVGVPVTKRKCYEVDPQTLEFRDPADMRLNYVKQYGFGQEVRESPFWKIQREIKLGKPSFWDYAAADLMQQKAFEQATAMTGEQNRQILAAAPTMAGVPGPDGQPTPIQSPLQPPIPPVRQTVILPPSFIDVPEEPEYVVVIKRYENPATGEVIGVQESNRFLVPTGCKRPEYLNPYESEVQYMETLPKDEHLRAQLHGNYLKMGVVDQEWVQDHTPEIADGGDELRRRMRSKMGAGQTQGMPQAGQGPGFSEMAPPDQKPLGDASGSGPESPDTAQQASQTANSVASQTEIKE